MTIRCRITTEPDGGVCLESAYDPQFVARLKTWIPWDGRKWDADRKRWLITPLYTKDLLELLQHPDSQVQLQDDRDTAPGLTPVPAMPDDLRQAFDALHVQYSAPLCVAEASWKALCKYYHPDVGGSGDECRLFNNAITVIRGYLNPREPGPIDDDLDNDIPF